MRSSFSIFLGLAFTVFACGSSGSDATDNGGSTPPSPEPTSPQTNPTDPPSKRSLAISAQPFVTLRRGKDVGVPLTITRTGFDGPVEITATGAPSGVSAKSIVVPPGESSASIVLAASLDATLGKTKIKVRAKAAPNLETTADVELLVADGQRLDSTFGKGGILQYWPDMHQRWSRALAVQPDAKIIVSVQWDPSAEGPPAENMGGVYRFTEAGAIDPTFGTSSTTGLIELPALRGAPEIALQPDGKIIGCGIGKTDETLTLVRITPAGALDTTFGTGGILKGPAGLGTCYGIALDGSGRYVVTSYKRDSPSAITSSAVVLRYLASGALDTSFGSGGIVTTKLGGKTASLRMVRLAPSGSALYFTGTRTMEGTTYQRGIVAKMTDAGELDTTFGVQGVHEDTYSVFEVMPLASSLLYAVGTDVLRLSPQGTLDSTYKLDKGPPNGPILSYGMSVVDAQEMQYRFKAAGGNWYAELWAFKPDGALDTSFANGGRISVQPGMDAQPNDMVIGPDGRLVVLAGSGAAIWMARFVL